MRKPAVSKRRLWGPPPEKTIQRSRWSSWVPEHTGTPEAGSGLTHSVPPPGNEAGGGHYSRTGETQLCSRLGIALVTTTSGPYRKPKKPRFRRCMSAPVWAERPGSAHSTAVLTPAVPWDPRRPRGPTSEPGATRGRGWEPWTPSSASPTRARAGTDFSGESGAVGLHPCPIRTQDFLLAWARRRR